MPLTTCEYCGATLDLSLSDKCPSCGGSAKKPDQRGRAATTVPESSSQRDLSGTGTASQQPTPESSASKNIKYVALICGGLIVVVFIGLILIGSMSSLSSYQPSSSVSSYKDPIVGSWQGSNTDRIFTFNGYGTGFYISSSDPKNQDSFIWKKESSNQYSLTYEGKVTAYITYNPNNDRWVGATDNEYYRR